MRECPVCDKTIQIAHSDYCIGCMQELRAIVMSATALYLIHKFILCQVIYNKGNVLLLVFILSDDFN